MPRDSCKSKTYCWKKKPIWMLIASFVYFSFVYFFLSCFFFFCLLFVTSHTLSSNIPNYFLTTRFSWFFPYCFFFFRLVLKNHDFVIFMIFFLTASMLILRGPSFCFRCGFAGMDLVFIYMTHSCGVKYFSICCWCKSLFFFGDFSELNQIQPLAGPVSVLVRYWPDLRSVCPLSQFLDYFIQNRTWRNFH